MRLSRIRLAGFKSFVDPTSIAFPGAVGAVVGPNGCGKSNVIDAVRWVMGESSAKHLRGESMADVIFNGSSARKPVGHASVELQFDNSDGSLGGKYAAYAEISVKRVVNRDGQSAYYLNATRCRRRDITDVFLGTGLGPRSYSIIEQGTISRLIEARPEELRAYLEEAAGISLYKERRRETERRIRDTLENLSRLDDLRDEVGRQLEKLRRQAESAERYRRLRAEERRCRAELLVLRLREMEQARADQRRELDQRVNALEASRARSRSLERDAEASRAAHGEVGDQLNAAQGRYYALGSELAAVESRIAHRRELRERQGQELTRAEQSLQELEQELAGDQEKLDVLESRLQALGPQLAEATGQEQQAEAALAARREAREQWRAEWEAFQREAAEPVREAQVERARIEQLERRALELGNRAERAAAELERLDLRPMEMERDELAAEQQSLEQAAAQARAEAEAAGARLAELREEEDERAEALHEVRGEVHRGQARLTSLETLQKAALGDDGGPPARWLADRGLHERRLVQSLDVEPGWERAVEVVLGDALEAALVDDPQAHAVDLPALEQGRLMLFAPRAGAAEAGTGLASRVRAPWPVTSLLGGVHCAADLEEAARRLPELADGESVITPDGVWLGRNWARFQAAGSDDGAGVLEREREIASLRDTLAEDEQRAARLAADIESLEERLLEQEEARDDARAEANRLERRLAEVGARGKSLESRLADARRRRERLLEDQAEIQREREASQSDVQAARSRLTDALARGEALEQRRPRLEARREELDQAVRSAQEQLTQARQARHDLALRREGAATAAESARQAIARSRGQAERLAARAEELRGALAELDAPGEDLDGQRQALLERQAQAERELTEVRRRQGEVEQRLRELERQRAAAESETAELREAVEAARLREQEIRLRAQTLEEQLGELEVDANQVRAGLADDAEPAVWERQLAALETRIQRLGAVNLAAIDECQVMEERKGYLDAQHADLSEAMDTLQGAIRRIDRETRNRFRETFDKVNEGVQRLFPRLIGGGRAYLELTGDDLLETGVTVMAQPPGKRITNIHLLSGGEKALTAVALVFALFELNPAPFCMLDEVDAPLDEANVGRFCEMLQEMSRWVQFVIITHNKTTMEIAGHLIGVTMNEPGVSRLVAVDVDEAAELAGA